MKRKNKSIINNFISFSLIFSFIFSLMFIFDYRQNDSEIDLDNDNYSENNLETPKNALIPNKDIYNDFKVWYNYEYSDKKPYMVLSDSNLQSAIISSQNATCIIELTNNYEKKSTLLGCFFTYHTSNNSNISKTLRISLLKENKSIILFQETTTYKPFSNKFIESYTPLNNISIGKEKILIEIFFEKECVDGIEFTEIYLLPISDNNLYSEIYIEQYELIFILEYKFYENYKQLIKLYLYLLILVFYVIFYIFQIKNSKLRVNLK